MANGYLISHILLWTLMLIQMAFLFYLTRLIVQFLNRFRLSDKQAVSLTLQIGQRAPDFREKDQHGAIIRPASGNHQESLLLFVQDTCSKCKGIVAQLELLHKRFHRLRMIVIGGKIYYEKGLSAPEGIHFIRSDELLADYYIRAVPTAFLLDASGDIVEMKQVAAISDLVEMLEEQINQVS